jgi:alpha/beta superfamily hydrolase
MKVKLSIFFFGLVSSFVFGQLPYSQPQFAYDSLMDVVYGTAVDYAGNPVTLTMDIYKPKADSNCLRPVVVLVHGGAWIGGSKNDVDLVVMSREFAKRGWVVANINYRLGTHKASNYVMYALCNTNLSQPCAYIADSAEVLRANFRGMQDAKGAIRFMKNRNSIDSSDVNNVFIAGESAGGFISLAAAFSDQASEKPAACFAIANAPVPSASLATYGCISNQNSLARPDLGSIDGNLHLGIFDASVKGVGNIFGAVFDLNVFQQASGNSPAVYLFHQGSDVVVNYNYGKILGRTSWECYAQTNLCQTYYFYPFAYGSEGIRQHFVSLGSATPSYTADIVYNYNYLNNCFSNGHSIDNFSQRFQSMVDLFAGQINLSGNLPPNACSTADLTYVDETFAKSIYPNPVQDELTIKFPLASTLNLFQIYDATGRCILSRNIETKKNQINVSELSPGIYFLRTGNESSDYIRFVKQ